MTEMTPAEAVYFAAAALPAADRAAYLAHACAGRDVLRQQVERMLAARDAVGDFLDPAPPDGAAGASPFVPTTDYVPRGEQAGTVIDGKYTLVEAIGEGGMGAVWRAKQTEPVKRFVAVKLIKAGMDTKQVLARFEAERQALALMDHPNIAKVLDGGVYDGRPYFVMELVKGVPITEFCDARKLTPRERLELFVPVCQAIQHAHQKGIIHRDIKPTNVLIALYDDKPVVKVIDFGVAKATGGTLTEHTIDTGFGGVVGTPQYMSPEQATFNNLDIDTRSDVYALGVLLYELLTGSPPFARKELEKRGLLEILRVVREEEPPRPSTKLSTADALPTLSANRGTEPKKLTGLLRNELDWIVLKALEKDRTRRYETANGFAADVQRYLSGDAVQAHPPSTIYRLKKFVRRNKGRVVAAGVVFFALLAGVIGTGIGLIRANRAAENEFQARERESAQRDRAEKAYARTADVLDTMVSEITGKSLDTQKAISNEQKKFLAEVLTYYREFAGERADDETMRARTARAAYRVGVIELRLGRKEEGAVAFRHSRDGFAALAVEFPAVPEYRRELARGHNGLGFVLFGLGKYAEAGEQYRTALAIREKLAVEFPAVPEYRRELAKSHDNLGRLLEDLGKYAEAEEQYRTALAIQGKLVAEFPAVPEYRRDLAGSHNKLGLLLHGRGKHPEAEEQYRTALAIQGKLAAEFPAVPEYRQELATSHNNLGILLAVLGKLPEAEELVRKGLAIQGKLAAEFPAVPEYRQELATSHNNLGNVLSHLGKDPEAEKEHRTALAIWETLVAEFPAVPEYRQGLAMSHNNLGQLLAVLGRHPEAVEQHRTALAIKVKLVAEFPAAPEYRQELARSHSNLGILLQGLGKRPEAEEQCRTALAIQGKLVAEFPAVPEYRRDLARSHNGLGVVLAGLGKRPEAEKEHRTALAIWEALVAEFPAVPESRQGSAASHTALGSLLKGLGRRPEAEKEHRTALAIWETLAAEFPTVLDYRVDLGGSYSNVGGFVLSGKQACREPGVV